MAAVRPDGYLLVDELCDASELPRHFVAKIFQDLVRKRLLVSAKGRGGGFALARKPRDIRLFDIVNAVDGADYLHECVVGMKQCSDAHPCPQHEQWCQFRDQIHQFLTGTTLEQMSDSLREKRVEAGQPLEEPSSRSKPIRR